MLQVMNIINTAQESSPVPVTEALDRVLQILRSTELYSPQFGAKDDDPHANDLVGGLVSVSLSEQTSGESPSVLTCFLWGSLLNRDLWLSCNLPVPHHLGTSAWAAREDCV